MSATRTFRAVVDRIEGAVAVLVPNGGASQPFELPLALLPPVQEGAVLAFTVADDPAATAARAREVADLIAELQKKNR
jgi:hypothetical protein